MRGIANLILGLNIQLQYSRQCDIGKDTEGQTQIAEQLAQNHIHTNMHN